MSTLEIHADPHSTEARWSVFDFAELVAYSCDGTNQEVAMAAYRLVMWTGNDCPWFVPHPVGPCDDLKECAAGVSVPDPEAGEGL